MEKIECTCNKGLIEKLHTMKLGDGKEISVKTQKVCSVCHGTGFIEK
jgi:DnaJ-class molecular chaperone